ncbi:hypothetical protein FRX31_011969 [Thalictrum thalictroides]|uniref:Polyphenol oxidase C-terminal domain-containing protein n=1 Tax=Thalictrum thalictroides TaxID=46969 RepID=A0A7J6WM57_THATH|nr:hypothetical protein FRX31_011969 [Thalictrum thalictroides]
MDPTVARHALNAKHNVYLSAQSCDFRPEERTLDSTITAKVQRPKNHRKTDNEEEILVVYGIDIKEDAYVKFDVYVNAIDATTIGPESREFAGTYVNLPCSNTMTVT